MANQWFRVYSEIINDRKLQRAASKAGVDRLTMIGAFVSLMCLANDSPIPGKLYVTLQERFSNKDVADELEITPELWKKISEALINYEVLSLESGVYCIKNWDKRQFLSDKSTERVRKYRAKRYSNVSETDQNQKQKQNLLTGEENFDLPPNVKNPGAFRALAAHEARRQNGEPDLSWLDEYLWPLARQFIVSTDIVPIKSEYSKWHKDLKEFWECGIRADDIPKAVKKMRGDGLTIKSPASIFGVLRDQVAKSHDGGEVFTEVH